MCIQPVCRRFLAVFLSLFVADMRVLFFLPDLDGGGAQRTIINLVNKMTDQGVDATLVVARSGGAAQNWLGKHVKFIDLKVSRTRYAVLRLRNELLRMQPDVLFSTMVDANIVATLAAVGLRKRMRVILRETNSHCARGDIRGLRRVLIGWSYRRADVVVALSSGVREELLADYQIDAGKVVTIGNPIDVEALVSASEVARKNTPPFAMSDKPVVMAAGRLTRQKGFDVLIRAFAQVKLPGRLVILGEGPDRDNLLALAEKEEIADRLLMPGFVAVPVSWFAHADVFVLSSRWEGFGHVIVEAMAASVPVIATDCPHGPADIVIDGQNGILVREGDHLAIAAAIEDLLGDPAKAAVLTHAASSGITQFNIEEIANTYLKILMGNDT